MKITLENRLKRLADGKKGPLSSVVFRSTEIYHGTARHDNVKVAVETDGHKRMYFGRYKLLSVLRDKYPLHWDVHEKNKYGTVNVMKCNIM